METVNDREELVLAAPQEECSPEQRCSTDAEGADAAAAKVGSSSASAAEACAGTIEGSAKMVAQVGGWCVTVGWLMSGWWGACGLA